MALAQKSKPEMFLYTEEEVAPSGYELNSHKNGHVQV